jgi:transcription antitermination factor NusG
MLLEPYSDRFPRCPADLPLRLWYALRVKARHEKRVSDNLSAMGRTVFLPQYLSRRRWTDRYKETLFPLFPGYTFCRLSASEHWWVPQLPSVHGIVGFGNTPTPLDEDEVKAIQSIAHSGLPAVPWPPLHCGDRVRLMDGPLRGLQGQLVSLRGTHRFVVAVSLLQRSVAVEIEREWLEPVTSKRPPSREMRARVQQWERQA